MKFLRNIIQEAVRTFCPLTGVVFKRHLDIFNAVRVTSSMISLCATDNDDFWCLRNERVGNRFIGIPKIGYVWLMVECN